MRGSLYKYNIDKKEKEKEKKNNPAIANMTDITTEWGSFYKYTADLLCMSQQLGSEVERQGKARQASQLHPGQL